MRGTAWLLLGLLAASFLAGCTGATRSFPPTTPRQTEEVGDGVYHLVRPGQTLWRIARVYGVPIEVVARANGLEDPTRIEVGQRLLIPGAARVREVPPAPEPLPGADEPGAPPGSQQPPVPGSEPEPEAGLDTDWRWPLSGPISSGFGAPRAHGSRRHLGIDIAAPRGTEIRAARGGRVRSAGRRSGYGRTVVLEHRGGFTSLYAHLSRIAVSSGQPVRAGQVIGWTGHSGNANGTHLHFEIRHEGRPVDPRLFLP
jgi:murein DD-endopeptidase MepM/ murein hydrolase activator NlpD